MISYTLSTLPPLTEAQEANLKALAARPESEIDYTDIPKLTEEQWKDARLGVFYLERQSFEPHAETVTNTMSESAYQKIERGLEEAKAYMKSEREGNQVTRPSGATPWANLEHKASPEKRAKLKQEALAELDTKTISEQAEAES